ncbi:MAG TPA: VCBS repeat-containing protein, partial [Bacillota bacterium]|nr:VCBS repeat-containing protein [Bacillota bacterium]
YWYQNPGKPDLKWKMHFIAVSPGLEAGGVVLDVNRDGRLDIVVGQQGYGNELYWFECPEDPTKPWTRHIIEDRFCKYHDQAVGDIDGDGEPELLFVSQHSRVLGYYDIPRDPYVSPWPRECFHVISTDFSGEGLVIADIDGDGENEVIAGTSIFKRRPTSTSRSIERGYEADQQKVLWDETVIVAGLVDTRVAVADLDGDGRLEIVFAEGESDPARLVWCHAPDWEPNLLKGDLFHPHSLQIADFDGDGRPDIFVGEMGLGRHEGARLIVFLNKGGGMFEESVIDVGIPTHEAKVADLTGDGRPDIVGKPYHPKRQIDVWYNETPL